jgi:uridine nucleosidase
VLANLFPFIFFTGSDVFGITAGPPLHDPIAMAAVLVGTPYEISFVEWEAGKSTPPEHKERFDVSVVTEGTFEEARQGKKTGMTTAKALPAGEQGVRIPRGMDVGKFWATIEECIERADEVNSRAGN